MRVAAALCTISAVGAVRLQCMIFGGGSGRARDASVTAQVYSDAPERKRKVVSEFQAFYAAVGERADA